MAASSVLLEGDEDGYSSITGCTLDKAMDELNENPVTRSSMVKELRVKILQRKAELQVLDTVGLYPLPYWSYFSSV